MNKIKKKQYRANNENYGEINSLKIDDIKEKKIERKKERKEKKKMIDLTERRKAKKKKNR